MVKFQLNCHLLKNVTVPYVISFFEGGFQILLSKSYILGVICAPPPWFNLVPAKTSINTLPAGFNLD